MRGARRRGGERLKKGNAADLARLLEHLAGDLAGETDPSRRRFLALLGASVALASGISCSKEKGGLPLVPFAKRREGEFPGIASYYASSFQEAGLCWPVIVKVREGRPIHIQGNDLIPGRARIPHRALADLLSLYDPDRTGNPPVDASGALESLVSALKKSAADGKKALLLTGAVLSPTCAALISELRGALPNLEHFQWEPAADQAAKSASIMAFGEELDCRPDFEKADVLLSLEADFLATDGDFAAATGAFAKRRIPGKLCRLYSFEGRISLTGAFADHRAAIRPSLLAPVAFAIAKELNRKHSIRLPDGVSISDLGPWEIDSLALECPVPKPMLMALTADLAASAGKSLALAGHTAPPEAHVACILLNEMLGSYGSCAKLMKPRGTGAISPQESEELAAKLSGGSFYAAVLWGVNPVYHSPSDGGWGKALSAVPFKCHLSMIRDETSAACDLFIPISHWLESWGDLEDQDGTLLLRQPACQPLLGTSQAEEILLGVLSKLVGGQQGSYLQYLKGRWEKSVFSRVGRGPFEPFWNRCLHDGFLKVEERQATVKSPDPEGVKRAVGLAAGQRPEGIELSICRDHKLFDGRYANNGWLQELPNPITKVTWENPLLLSEKTASKLGAGAGDLIKIEAGGRSLTAPLFVQPGQADGLALLAMGYGRKAGSAGGGIGCNAFGLLAPAQEHQFLASGVRLSKAGGSQQIPTTQQRLTEEGRDLARVSPATGHGRSSMEHGSHGELASLNPDRKPGKLKWGMAIDLSLCTGCGACTLACQSENNIPVVGPERILEGREMHWMRVDRYYRGDLSSPSVVQMPMLCQQCASAPCENVCPVNATTHSDDGLNQMAYNRCVGTRYCANNCPYKVRRFNFFDYTKPLPELLQMAFNPEVTIRPRGVMEKCTFCIQRLQEARQIAKGEGREVSDADSQPACAAACPAGAITFGNSAREDSEVSKVAGDPRGYMALEELGVRPSVTYLAKVVNPAFETGHGGGEEGA